MYYFSLCNPVPGYQGFQGECNGRDLRKLHSSSIQDCATSCKDDVSCVGFVYVTEIKAIEDGFLKNQTCAAPSIENIALSMYYKGINGKTTH